jgi:hypothetical protein
LHVDLYAFLMADVLTRRTGLDAFFRVNGGAPTEEFASNGLLDETFLELGPSTRHAATGSPFGDEETFTSNGLLGEGTDSEGISQQTLMGLEDEDFAPTGLLGGGELSLSQGESTHFIQMPTRS